MTASVGSHKLKVLFFSQRFPYPMDTGGKIRTGKLLEYLRHAFDVTLISNVESPKDDAYVKEASKLCSQFHPVPWKEVKKYSPAFYLNVILRSFSRYPITVINDYSRDLEEALHYVLDRGNYDVLVCDFLQPSINCWNVTGTPMVLFQHNVEEIIPRRHFETTSNPLGKLFWWLQWKKMQRYENMACRRFDAVVTVSEKDRQHLQAQYGVRNVFSIPTGVDTAYFSPLAQEAQGNSLVFTGSMDWLPNEDAILFFATEILGRIKERIPDVTLTVVGRNPSRRLRSALKGCPEVKVMGRVEDVREHIARHAVYIIPLRIGGGTRIKAYEAMAMGKAVVSTGVGVEGLPVKDREHLILADDAPQFAEAVINLLRNPQRRRELGMAAREFVKNNFSWERAGEAFAEVCRKVAMQAQHPIRRASGLR